MPSYEQKRYCKTCKTYTTKKICDKCGAETTGRGKWSVRFRVVKDGKLIHERLGGFEKKLDAENAYVKYMSSYKKPADLPEDITFQKLYESYKTELKNHAKESGYLTITSKVERHILPFFKDKKINKISTLDIAEWKAEFSNKKKPNGEPFSDRYKADLFITLATILNYGVLYFNLPNNITSKVPNFTKRSKKKEMLFWTQSEFEQFIKHVDNTLYKTVFMFLYLTGCRKGEMLAMTWQDVDLEAGTIDINKSFTRKTLDGAYKITSPKNESSYRKIMIPQNLINQLRAYRQGIAYQEFSETWFLFGGAKPISETTLDRKMKEYCLLSGVKPIRIHDLRHSHASLLISKGLNIVLISKRLGHSNTEQTLNTYAHMYPSDEYKAMEALDIKI